MCSPLPRVAYFFFWRRGRIRAYATPSRRCAHSPGAARVDRVSSRVPLISRGARTKASPPLEYFLVGETPTAGPFQCRRYSWCQMILDGGRADHALLPQTGFAPPALELSIARRLALCTSALFKFFKDCFPPPRNRRPLAPALALPTVFPPPMAEVFNNFFSIFGTGYPTLLPKKHPPPPALKTPPVHFVN